MRSLGTATVCFDFDCFFSRRMCGSCRMTYCDYPVVLGRMDRALTGADSAEDVPLRNRRSAKSYGVQLTNSKRMVAICWDLAERSGGVRPCSVCFKWTVSGVAAFSIAASLKPAPTRQWQLESLGMVEGYAALR